MLPTPQPQLPAGPLKPSITLVVVLSHFIAAFTALGLPPYLTEALKSMGPDHLRWAGIFYVLPTTFIALSAPFWGKLADRYGPRPLLLRAQLGLAVSYWLTGQADTPWLLAVSLILQGLLGGTFSASSAYLGSHLHGQPLSQALTWMQGSARLALLVAPVLVGVLGQHFGVLHLYQLFAVLPLFAALLTFLLPDAPPQPAKRGNSRTSLRPARRTFWLEFLFVLSTILGFPYFVEHVQGLTDLPWVPGMLFALPHLAYLLVAPLLRPHPRNLPVGFVLVAGSLLGHLLTENLLLLGMLRLLLGAGMACCITRVNDLAAELATHLPRGQLFGVLETYGKAGAVVAGALASLLAGHPTYTFLLGALLALTAVFFTFEPTRRLHEHPDPQT